jgi:hypothetical protein
LKIWEFGKIGKQASGVDDLSSNLKKILVERPFERALTCSILIAGIQVMLRKAHFLRRGSWLRPKSWTTNHGFQIPDRTIETHTKFQLSRCYTGWEIAHRRTDDITISVEPIFFLNVLLKPKKLKKSEILGLLYFSYSKSKRWSF